MVRLNAGPFGPRSTPKIGGRCPKYWGQVPLKFGVGPLILGVSLNPSIRNLFHLPPELVKFHKIMTKIAEKVKYFFLKTSLSGLMLTILGAPWMRQQARQTGQWALFREMWLTMQYGDLLHHTAEVRWLPSLQEQIFYHTTG